MNAVTESTAFRIDPFRGTSSGIVSHQWASRPDDQKFLNLFDLRAQVSQWAEESYTVDRRPSEFVAVFDPSDDKSLKLQVTNDRTYDLTHWSFQALCRAAECPPDYLRSIPPPLAAVNLNYGLRSRGQGLVSAYVRSNGSTFLRGITSARYGRIMDVDVVDRVIKIAGSGTGEMRWKVPGCIEWGNQFGISYNPGVDITKENTTLYASDRDVFLFLVDDRNPIQIGNLPDGNPDLVFRGFIIINSEVGARKFQLMTFYLRGVCQNRCLWGVEGWSEVSFKHTADAPERFIEEAVPMLMQYSNRSGDAVIRGVEAARKAIVAVDDESRIEFLTRLGLSKRTSESVIMTHMNEESRPPESVWDMSQGITALARREQFQEARVALERIAGKVLDKIKV